jgi:hypothetical protein
MDFVENVLLVLAIGFMAWLFTTKSTSPLIVALTANDTAPYWFTATNGKGKTFDYASQSNYF